MDWFIFTVEIHGEYVLSVSSVDGDPTMALYGPGDVIFVSEDDDGGSGNDSQIRSELLPGLYHLAVREFREDDFFYSVQLKLETVEYSELRESDVRDPIPLDFGTRFKDWENQGGFDWFTFTVEERGLYLLSAMAEDNDPTMALYGPDAFVFVTEDDDGGDGFDSRIRKELFPGRYFLAIRAYDGLRFSYSLKVAALELLVIGGDSKKVESDGKSDWFVFSVERGGNYLVSVESEDGDPALEIYEANTDMPIANDDDGGLGSNAALRREFLAGDYFLNVREFEGKPLKYSVTVSKEDVSNLGPE